MTLIGWAVAAALLLASGTILAQRADADGDVARPVTGPRVTAASSLPAVELERCDEEAWTAAPTISERPFPCSRMVIVARWAAITDQRRDVLDLTYGEVRRILRGEVLDWSDLGGSPQAISVFLPGSQARDIAAALGLSLADLRAVFVTEARLIDSIASTPGAFGLVEPEQLTLGVLALTVDRHDPYRDRARQSPLRLLHWVRARTQLEAIEQLSESGAVVAGSFDPVGMAVTGELIPVRCTNHVLSLLGDYDAMFDGVRDTLVNADIAVAPLEHPLTANNELTPCVETVTFTGSHRAVAAMANAGIDVVLTVGNHMMDCWQGCSGVAALYETLERLSNEGMVTAGAGESLRAARTPAVVRVRTELGEVTFAFLGYDIIAPWYHAEEDQPGTAPLEAEYLRRDISAAGKLADHVLVGVNWGVEYVSNPVAYQRDLAGVAMEAGATFLFGNHPHWVQAIEHFGDQLVAYSFGNFIFDQNWSIETTQGMLMELGFSRERLLGYRVRPVVIRAHSSQLPWLYRPEFVDPAGEGRPIMNRIWNATDRLPARPIETATIPENPENQD
ncbi:MAG: CapA family protein [Chloroflexi bacterium]|nr:CapA family protein [Chloroflexota bacterium]MCY3589497.1 CapA family protein [Chloroflexota bacterium]MCY3685057.1 CapA family protein [Chloroflexota bacterium]MDE2707711.1 CapA family protein [Chloroflexota bacterium]